MSLLHKDQEQSVDSFANKETNSKGKRAGKTTERKSKAPTQRVAKRETAAKKTKKADLSQAATRKTISRKTSEVSKSIKPVSWTALQNEIRERAFFIYIDKETTQGSSNDELSNWLQAEQEVKAKYGLIGYVNR